VTSKQDLRERLIDLRKRYVASLPQEAMALMFYRPPTAIARLAPTGASIALYCAAGSEAPTLSYAKWFHENGRALALPYFADEQSPMSFRVWHNPYDDDELEKGPFGLLQPGADAPTAAPTVAFVPLIGFTAAGHRLGRGGGHYDRWLAENPGVTAIGLGWDCQLADALPQEAHDQRLDMVITTTQAFGGQS